MQIMQPLTVLHSGAEALAALDRRRDGRGECTRVPGNPQEGRFGRLGASFNYCSILNEFYQLNNHVWILLPIIDH